MSERPFMQLYVSDFIGDTLHLSAEQVGAYMLLLMAMWNAHGSLPNDAAKLARVARMSLKKWRAVEADIMAFFTVDGESVSHGRLIKELQKSERKSQSRSSAGAEGGKAKALKDKERALANAIDMPQHLPDTIKKEKKVHTVHSHPERDEDFEKFWAVYPKREGPNPRKPAFLTFKRAIARGVHPETLIRAAAALAVEHPVPTRFVPQAVTFLNQERWEPDQPIILGDEFCPNDWAPTRPLVIRYRNENNHDPPPAVQNGKSGFLLPAAWVQAVRNNLNGQHRLEG